MSKELIDQQSTALTLILELDFISWTLLKWRHGLILQTDFNEAAYLAFCLQPAARAGALLDLAHV